MIVLGNFNPLSEYYLLIAFALLSILISLHYQWVIKRHSKILSRSFNSSSITPTASPTPQLPFVSVIIPARNEEQNISEVLLQLFHQDYPINKFEIIIVDDESDDNTEQIVNQLIQSNKTHTVKLIKANQVPPMYRGKKNAIATGIEHSHGTYICLTDADALPPPNWISNAMQHIPENDLLLGSVQFEPIEKKNNLLFQLQWMEQQALKLFANAYLLNGNPILCNGANLIYSKAAYLSVNGFDGHYHVPSGDDTLLLEKMLQTKKRISNIPNETPVLIHFENTWKSYFSQRFRWLSKSTYSKSKGSKQLATYLAFITVWPLFSLLVLAFQPIFGLIIPLFYWYLKTKVDQKMTNLVIQNNAIQISTIKLFLAEITYAFVVLILLWCMVFPPNSAWKNRPLKR